MAIVSIFQQEGEALQITSAKPKDVTVAMAERATPRGVPFKLIDESEVTADPTFRAAWEWDGDLTVDNDGYGGGVAPVAEEK